MWCKTMSTKKKYYGYEYEELDIGYEVTKLKDGAQYFVSHTDLNGWSCNCNGILIGKCGECKHIRNVKRLYNVN